MTFAATSRPAWKDDPTDPFSDSYVPRRSSPKAPVKERPAPTHMEHSGDGGPVGYRYGGHSTAHGYASQMSNSRGVSGVTVHTVGGGRVRGARVTAGYDPKTGSPQVTVHHNGVGMPGFGSQNSQTFAEHQIHALDFDHR